MNNNSSKTNMNQEKQTKPKQAFESETIGEGEWAAHRLRECRAKNNLIALQNLMQQQDSAMRIIFADMAQYKHDENTLTYVRRLQEKSLELLACLNETHRQRESLLHIWTEDDEVGEGEGGSSSSVCSYNKANKKKHAE